MLRKTLLPLGLIIAVLIAYQTTRVNGSGTHGFSGPTAPSCPNLQLERDTWDFGTVRPGETLIASFPVSNIGTRRLVLNKVSHSCDCASAAATTMIVPAGETAPLEARLETENIQGAVQIELDYSTSDPKHPAFKLKLRADVQP